MRLAILVSLLLGGWVLFKMWARGRHKTVDLTGDQVATTIQNFLDGSGGKWDWDDFISFPITDPKLEAIRERCNGLSAEFPTTDGHYCGPAGFEVLKSLMVELRGKSA
jgi:hypothetical protein